MFMYETIKRIYLKTGNREAVEKAQEKGWITAEQAQTILDMATDPEETAE